MKKFFSDWRTGAAVLALTALIMTPFGAWRSLRRAVEKVEAGFDAENGYLSDSVNAARNLVTLGASLGLDEETDALRAAIRAAQDAGDGSVAGKAAANRALAGAFESLAGAISRRELDERDAESLRIYSDAFAGPQAALGRSGYNEDVRAFVEDVYDKFPAKFVASLFDVDPPAYFDYVD